MIHTNGIENFWALLKRGLHGTYISVEPFHLFRYIDEQAFRYEHRATKDKPYTNADRFAIALSQIAGKRLTWDELTGKVEGSCLGSSAGALRGRTCIAYALKRELLERSLYVSAFQREEWRRSSKVPQRKAGSVSEMKISRSSCHQSITSST